MSVMNVRKSKEGLRSLMCYLRYIEGLQEKIRTINNDPNFTSRGDGFIKDKRIKSCNDTIEALKKRYDNKLSLINSFPLNLSNQE